MGRECFYPGFLRRQIMFKNVCTAVESLCTQFGTEDEELYLKPQKIKHGEVESFVLHLTTNRDLPAGVKSIKNAISLIFTVQHAEIAMEYKTGDIFDLALHF